MATPKAHEQHDSAAEKAAARKHEPEKAEKHDGGGHDAGADEPTGYPDSDRHQTETHKPGD